MNERLIDLIVEETPNVVTFLQSVFKRRHPDQPAPTSEEVIAASQVAFTTSLAKDDAFLKETEP